jgi:hypothetical protein
MMATKAQLDAVAAAQKAFDDQLAITKTASALAKTKSAVAKTAQNQADVAFAKSVTAGQTPELTPTEERLFGVTGPTSPKGVPTGPTGGATGSTGGATGTAGGLTAEQLAEAEKRRRSGQSAYDILLAEFTRYGLQALVEPLKGLITSGASSAEFSLALQNTDAYKKRFAANQKRIDAGLGALSPAEYVALEDQYQNIMRNYGLPASYYTKDSMGTQQGFEKFLAADVSATELEDRIMTAQNRVINANPEVANALKSFYPDITNGDILAYTLNPQQGLSDIKRKITTAEIGGAAARSGLTTNVSDAEYLQRYGVTKETADQGYTTIASGLQRGSQLASIYGEDPYTQATAETEVFNVPGAAEARKQRQKITGLEKATFGGQTGITQGTLARDRAGAY